MMLSGTAGLQTGTSVRSTLKRRIAHLHQNAHRPEPFPS